MENIVIKEIKKRLTSLLESNVNVTTQVDCFLKTMQAINFLSRPVQDLTKCGITPNVTFSHETYMECAKF